MKKIQLSSIEELAKISIIKLDTSFITRAVKAQLLLESAITKAKKPKEKFNETTQKYEKVLDENGNQVYSYNSINPEDLDTIVLPFLKDLVDAMEE